MNGNGEPSNGRCFTSILIVEDEPAHVELLQRALSLCASPPTIRVAETLARYRCLAAEARPDLVLMDMHLPDGNALEELIYPPSDGLFPIVLMTSHGNEEIAAQAIKAGAMDYIVKTPDSYAHIPQTLRQVLNHWQALQDQKKSRLALEQAKQQWELTFDAVPDLIAIIDLDHTILRINRAMALRCGISPAAAVGRHCYELVHRNQPEVCPICPLAQLKATGTISCLEFTEPSLGGRWFQVTVSPLHDEAGGLTGCVHIMHDITADKEARLREQRLEAQLRHAQKLEAIGTLAGGIAHDFNNILQVIQTYGALLSQAAPPGLTATVTEMLSAVQRGEALTRDLLLFSRRQPGDALQQVELNDLLGETVSFLQRGADRTHPRPPAVAAAGRPPPAGAGADEPGHQRPGRHGEPRRHHHRRRGRDL